VLSGYPHAPRVNARLVELDERNVAVARQRADEASPSQVEVVVADAARLAAYEGAAPADIVLACGVFGNIRDRDVFHTIDLLPQLCRPAATVIWTRNRVAPDLTPAIRAYFLDHRFAEVDSVADAQLFRQSVGVNRYVGGAAAIAVRCAVLHVPRGAALRSDRCLMLVTGGERQPTIPCSCRANSHRGNAPRRSPPTWTED
jgi:hypothetical protein